jgi:hypothetical protein
MTYGSLMMTIGLTTMVLKTLFTLSRCRIAEDNGSGELLSRLQMYVDEQDKVALVAQQRRRRKTRCISASWFFLLPVLWRQHVFIGNNYLGLQRLVTD